MRRVIGLSTIVIAVWLTHCTTPRRPLAPRDAPVEASAANFGGTYCFLSMEESFREHDGGIGFLLPRGIERRSLVSIAHDPTRISLTYAGAGGVPDQVAWSTADSEWRDGKLTVPIPSGGNPFGAYHSRSWLTIYRLQDGRLVVQRNDADTGLTCLLIPSHDKRESMLILSPSRHCGAA